MQFVKMGKIALAGVAALGMTAGGAAAQEFNWKLNNNFSVKRPETRLLNGLAKDIEAKTGGKMKVKVYDGGSLGLKDADILRWLPSGGAEIGVLNASFIGRDAPALNAVYIQGIIRSVDDHVKALPVLEKVQVDALKKWDLHVVGYMAFPVIDASIFCRKDPVNTLEQLRKKKLRVWSKDLIESFKAVGVSAQIVPQNELYVALKTGVVDCALYPARFAGSISLNEVTKYAAYLFPVSAVPYAIVVSEKNWAKLPDDVKKGMTAAVADLYTKTKNFSSGAVAEKKARAALEAKGVKWLPDFPAADRQAFADAAAKTWADLAKKAGGKASEYRQMVFDAMRK